MSKRSAVMFACAVAGVVSGLTSAVKAGTFVDNFNNGSITDSDTIPGFWSASALTGSGGGPINTIGSSIVETSGPTGNSTMTYNGPTGQVGGPAMVSGAATAAEFNPFTHAETVSVTAAPGTSLIPGTDYTGGGLGNADTWLVVDGDVGGFRPDNYTNRFVLALTGANQPYFYVKDNNNSTANYAEQSFSFPAPSATELVTSMSMYIDGTQEAQGHLFVDYTETCFNTSTQVSTTYQYRPLPIDFGTGSGMAGTNNSQAELDGIKSGYANGAAIGLEVENAASNTNGNESVSFSQVTDIFPQIFNGAGGNGGWFAGVQGVDTPANNFNSSSGMINYENGSDVTFDDNVTNGGHNTGQFTINISRAAGVYPNSVNVSGTTPYVFSGIGGINGIGGLNVLGPSSLTLLNASNTYSGTTNISAGTLIAGATNVLSPNSPVVISGGTLDVSGFNQSIASLNMSSGTMKLGASTVLTDTGTATFAGTLNLVGTPASFPDILMTYQSSSGTFASNNLPAGEALSYTSGALEVISVGSTGPSTLTWVNASANNLWDTTSFNWNGSSSTAAYSDTSNATLSAGDNVIFNDSNGGVANYNVSIPATVHPTSVTVTTNSAYTFNGSGGIAGPGSLTLSGTGSLTLAETNTYSGGTNVSGGTLILAKASALPSGSLLIGSGAKVVAENLGTAFASTISSLNMSGGSIDLNDNDLVVQKSNNATLAGNLTAVTTLVAAGYKNGAWNGSTGIMSTTASQNPSHLTALGVLVNDSNGTAGGGSPLYGTGGTIAATFGGVTPAVDDVLIKYTYYGDANLSGKVDSADYSRIDAGFLSHLTGWQNGDFNYDGVVNGSDYTLIDNAFNMQGAQLSAQLASSTVQIAGSGTTSAVPEPASLGLLGMGVAGLLGRRNRRCH